MTRAFIPLLVLLCFAAGVLADDKANEKEKDKDDPFNQELHDELLKMSDQDQELQKELLKNPKNPDQALLRKLNDLRRKNTNKLKDIVDKYGWPTPKLVGNDGVNAAFVLTQHAIDREFQKKCLKQMEALAQKEELPAQYFAGLTDYILIMERKRQRYGTQFMIDKKGELVPHPIEDEKNVDKRREEVGLPKLADHIEMARKQYKPMKP
jgi:hypothetical protein